jgi:hypothetical protein
MELSDRAIRLLARLSRARRLYAECKGADLDALQELGLLQWFDARSSTTPFKEDPRPLFRLLLFSGRIDYFWVEPVENLRELVGPEVSAKVDAIDEMEWAVTSGPLTGAGRPEQTRSRPKAIARALAGAERHAVKTIADALGTARSNLVAQAALPRRRGRRPQPEPELLTEIRQVIAGQPVSRPTAMAGCTRRSDDSARSRAGRRSTSSASTGW